MRISIARLNLRRVARLSAAFGLALTFACLPAAAQQWTPQQTRRLRTGCHAALQPVHPRRSRVSACMSAYRRYLSPACRAVFYGGQKKKMRRR
jgi:hypothetical protein